VSLSATIDQVSATKPSRFDEWSTAHSRLLLLALTRVCLVPFSGRAFHGDDPLFICSGQQILKHPFDAYGFQGSWDHFYASFYGPLPYAFGPPIASVTTCCGSACQVPCGWESGKGRSQG
jgi:hypothetical protein